MNNEFLHSASPISRRVALAGLGASGLGLTLSARVFGVTAQDATPPTGPIKGNQLAPGVVAEVFVAAPSARAPEQTVYVARFTFQPGAEIFAHSHPGTTILGVASGTFGWVLLAGTAHVVRGAASGAADPAEDITEVGTEVILEPGDAIYYEDDVVHTASGADGLLPNQSRSLDAGPGARGLYRPGHAHGEDRGSDAVSNG